MHEILNNHLIKEASASSWLVAQALPTNLALNHSSYIGWSEYLRACTVKRICLRHVFTSTFQGGHATSAHYMQINDIKKKHCLNLRIRNKVAQFGAFVRMLVEQVNMLRWGVKGA